MLLKNKTDWNLLARYMAGETNETETETVHLWADKSAANSSLFNEIKSDWKKMEKMDARFNVDKAWNKLHGRIAVEDSSVNLPPLRSKSQSFAGLISVPIRIAASLLLLTILGFAVYAALNRFQKIDITASVNEKGKLIELSDGSKVYLNGDTRLSYTRQFGRKSRVVRLDGEAFFEVTPDKSKPFRIYAGNASIKVLGTSFNIDSRKNDRQVEVYVSTGVVELSETADQNNRILLHPGNIGRFEQKTISLEKANNENSLAWKTGELTFTATPLSQVIPVLNNVYDVHIVINAPDIGNTRIDGSYHGDPLDQILLIICQQNDLTIVKSADTIYLSR
jgi:transmembrane sensor